MPPTHLELRRIFGCFATGVTVITCRAGARTHGITVNSYTSVSLNPPLILVCIDKKAIAFELLKEAGTFAVNVLAERQREISDYFAKRLAPDPDDELAQVPHSAGITSAPLIDGALAHIECKIAYIYPGGDHDIFVGEVLDARIASEAAPLLFHRGQYPHLAQS
jgi:flavin reductase (DIM6/NTAB) family NADH-FMN oxidoreductase RutF